MINNYYPSLEITEDGISCDKPTLKKDFVPKSQISIVSIVGSLTEIEKLKKYSLKLKFNVSSRFYKVKCTNSYEITVLDERESIEKVQLVDSVMRFLRESVENKIKQEYPNELEISIVISSGGASRYNNTRDNFLCSIIGSPVDLFFTKED